MKVPRVKYDVIRRPEDELRVEDEFEDQATVDWIRDQLVAGNEWAWCCIEVRASVEYDGHTFIGNTFLGACSYKSEADFSSDDGFLPQLKADALQDLRDSLAYEARRGSAASELLAQI